MNNPKLNTEIWTTLRQKWETLAAEGHVMKVEFNILKDPVDETNELAIDVAQDIDGEWVVQTVQRKAREAYSVIGIDGLRLDQLIELAGHMVNAIRESITDQATDDDEMHLFMKRISPETSETYGHVISKTGEKIGVRTNYQHYYVLNEILEQMSKVMKQELTEVQLHRDKNDFGRIYFRFVPA